MRIQKSSCCAAFAHLNIYHTHLPQHFVQFAHVISTVPSIDVLWQCLESFCDESVKRMLSLPCLVYMLRASVVGIGTVFDKSGPLCK